MFGLNKLMEAVSISNDRTERFDYIFEANVELADDVVKQQFMEDSVEADMAGDGISLEDEKRYEKLLAKIPKYDESMEDDIDSMTESFDFFEE